MQGVLVFGDSLTMGVTVHGQVAYTHSLSGWKAESMHAELEHVLRQGAFEIIVICAGFNDLGHGRSPDETFTSLRELYGVAMSHATTKIVIACAIPAAGFAPHQVLNEKIREHVLAAPIQLEYFDFFASPAYEKSVTYDGLHLNAQGIESINHALSDLVNHGLGPWYTTATLVY